MAVNQDYIVLRHVNQLVQNVHYVRSHLFAAVNRQQLRLTARTMRTITKIRMMKTKMTRTIRIMMIKAMMIKAMMIKAMVIKAMMTKAVTTKQMIKAATTVIKAKNDRLFSFKN